jgi:hypothetical protein
LIKESLLVLFVFPISKRFGCNFWPCIFRINGL